MSVAIVHVNGALPVDGASQLLVPVVALYTVTSGLSGDAAAATATSDDDKGVTLTLTGAKI